MPGSLIPKRSCSSSFICFFPCCDKMGRGLTELIKSHNATITWECRCWTPSRVMEEYLWKSCCTRTWARKLPKRLSWKINCWPLMHTCKNCRTIYGLRCSRESGCRQTSCRYNQRPSEMIEFPPGPRSFQLISFRAFAGPVNSPVTDLKRKIHGIHTRWTESWKKKP